MSAKWSRRLDRCAVASRRMWRQAFKNNDALWNRVSCYAPRLELADCRSLRVEMRHEHSGSQSDLVSSSGHLTTGDDGVGDRPLRATVMAFQSSKPIEEAVTPPSAWYTSCDFAQLEMERVFARGWQAVGHFSFHQSIDKENQFLLILLPLGSWIIDCFLLQFLQFLLLRLGDIQCVFHISFCMCKGLIERVLIGYLLDSGRVNQLKKPGDYFTGRLKDCVPAVLSGCDHRNCDYENLH